MEMQMYSTPARAAAHQVAEVTAEAELGALRSQVKALMRAIGYVEAEAPRLEKEARAAWKKRNPKALTHARSTLLDWLTVGDAVSAMQDTVDAFRAAHPEVEPDREVDVQRMLDDLERARDSVRRLGWTVRELVALEPVPAEPKPAARQLFGLRAKIGGLVKLGCAQSIAC
jgi:hypothetical protein